MNDFKTLKKIENVRLGILDSWRYCYHGNTQLAKSHVLHTSSLEEASLSSSFVTSADLEEVESRYLLIGKSSGGFAIHDTGTVKDESKYCKIGGVHGGSRNAHSRWVSCIQWYPVDAGLLCTSSSDKKLKVWDPNTLKMVEEFKFDYHIFNFHMSSVATNHALTAVAGDKGEIILCDLRTGSSSHRMHGHDGRIQVVQWARRQEHHLASGGKDRTIRLWDVRSGKSCFKILDAENSPPSELRLKKRAKKIPYAHKGRILSLRYTNDGLWLISFSSDSTVKLWNSNSGRNMNINYGDVCAGMTHAVTISTSYQTYPEFIYVPSKEKILVFSVLTGDLVNILEGHLGNVFGVVYNPNSKCVYSYGADGHFLTWTPKDLQPIKQDLEDVNIDSNNMQNLHTDSWSSDEG